MKTYIKILELAKKKEGWKNRIEELKFGCWIKSPVDGDIVRLGDEYGYMTNGKEINWETDKSYYRKPERNTILGFFTTIDLIDWLGKQYFYSDGSIYFYENYFGDRSLHDRIKLEAGKELHEQSEETLEKVYNLMKSVCTE